MLNKNVKQNNLASKSLRPSKRLGRGLASGKGNTSGRGTKGQKSRSGYNIPRRFEGGQTPWIQRLAKKKGFRSRKVKPQVVRLSEIEKKFKEGSRIDLESLFKAGIIKNKEKPIKVLADKKPEVKFIFRQVAISKNILNFKPAVKTVSKEKTKKE